jgi:hypothetical protein
MVDDRIAKDCKYALIIAESGRVKVESYVDNFLDQAELIPDMNQLYGTLKWTFMQGSACIYTASSTIACLKVMVTAVRDWPECSPDANPIEHL